MNNAPFSIGQKVVALITFGGTGIKKNDVVVVIGQKKCKCGVWLIYTGITLKQLGESVEVCHRCGITISQTKMWFSADRFAPIQTQYADATSEILEKFPVTEGGEVDKIILPEKATA